MLCNQISVNVGTEHVLSGHKFVLSTAVLGFGAIFIISSFARLTAGGQSRGISARTFVQSVGSAAFCRHFDYFTMYPFKVGRGGAEQRIPAHKFVLSVGSAVFDAMFNSTLATQEDEIVIPDVEPAAFLALLRFLYRYSCRFYNRSLC
jgi:hypothetical protein